MAETKAEVFIIESTKWDDEASGIREGVALSEVLRLAGKHPKYVYLRTRKEFVTVLDQFSSSKYRYLHISCHGTGTGLALTMNRMPFAKVRNLLGPHLKHRRLFVSACQGVRKEMAAGLISEFDCNSVIGPMTDIYFSHAAAIWAAFYCLMFDLDKHQMKSIRIEEKLDALCRLFAVEFNGYFGHEESPFWRYKRLGKDSSA